MTNEESPEAAAWRRGMMLVLDELAGDGNETLAPHLRVRRLRLALRKAKAQAYEEAMSILDRRSGVAENGDYETGGAVARELDEAYVEIRALKDSLASESVAS
jgi:hypothetical protein